MKGSVPAKNPALVNKSVKVSREIEQRAAQIKEASNIKSFDSLHLACAEAGAGAGADVLLTTDIKFLRNSQKRYTLR